MNENGVKTGDVKAKRRFRPYLTTKTKTKTALKTVENGQRKQTVNSPNVQAYTKQLVVYSYLERTTDVESEIKASEFQKSVTLFQL